MIPFAAALVVATLAQAADADRARAIELAREGQTAAAVKLFEAIAARDPADVDARLWLARLDMRAGHIDKAEAQFRAIHEAHPEDVDARIGLGAALTRKGELREALDVLEAAEREFGPNVDVYGALALACRRSGDDGRAMAYYKRALALAPNDMDIRDGYEALARTHGHGVLAEGFGQQQSPGSTIGGGSLTINVRAGSRLHVQGQLRSQRGDGYNDALAGAGVILRAGRANTVSLRASGGSGNTALANLDTGGEVMHYAGLLELGGSVRVLSFSDVDVVTLSPILAVDKSARWRFDGRYTYSHARFAQTAESKGDHSGLGRLTLRAWRRVWFNATYAYGIESFEELTADRLASLGAHTAAAGVRVNLRSLSVLNATWEHQWRSNDSRVDRVTFSIAQFFP